MSFSREFSGFAIALAWPQTYCKQPGSWYDPVALLLGFNHNNFYKVGHAAVVLIDKANLVLHYFDFGRYHAPYRNGRVRSAETDHDLELKTVPVISADGESLVNFAEILHELQNNTACHGEGELYASWCRIDFESAFAKAKQMQNNSHIPYGPFIINGSNCSRFVNTVIRAGSPEFRPWFRLFFNLSLTPTPIGNVRALFNRRKIPKLIHGEPFCPIMKLDRKLLKTTLPSPERHSNIPANAQWLSGEGAGSWFFFQIEGPLLNVTRYSPQGVIECKGLYENKDSCIAFRNNVSFTVDFPSNCKSVTLIVNGDAIRFQRVS